MRWTLWGWMLALMAIGAVALLMTKKNEFVS